MRTFNSFRKCIKLIEKVAPIRVIFTKDLAPRCPVCGRFTKKGGMIWNDHEKGIPSTCFSCYGAWKDEYFRRQERIRTRERRDISEAIWKKHQIERDGILEYFNSEVNFEDVGGLAELKTWLVKRVNDKDQFSDMPDTDELPIKIKG